MCLKFFEATHLINTSFHVAIGYMLFTPHPTIRPVNRNLPSMPKTAQIRRPCLDILHHKNLYYERAYTTTRKAGIPTHFAIPEHRPVNRKDRSMSNNGE